MRLAMENTEERKKMPTDETPVKRLFGRERPIHEILGSGKVADVLLWRNKGVSCAFSIGVMVLWFLFEVAEYNIVMIISYMTQTTMLVIFIWSNGARVFNWVPPNIPVIQLEESMLYKNLLEKVNFFLSTLINIACGKGIIHFCLTILAINLLAMIGNNVSTLNLLFIVLVCTGTLPYLYEKNEEEVDRLVHMINYKVVQIHKMLHEKIISKIPKWPPKAD